jgi:hypothetical protein
MVFALLLGGRFAFPASPLPCQSAADYRALLASVAQRANQPAASLSELADAVPEQCAFPLAGHTFQISTSQIRHELREIAAKPDPETRRIRLKSLQDSLQRRLDGIDAFERDADPTVKPKLQEIMQRSEFRHVSNQDPSAIFREWAVQFLQRLLSLIFKDARQIVLGAKILVWSLCLLIAGFILWQLYRWAMREAPAEAVREIIPFSPSAIGWRELLIQARAAAARGELREAVHCSYWSAISHLESSGAWRPDRARTPREYLRLIAQTDPSRPLLAGLTRDFEVIWYGNRHPAFSEWESFLAKVERIGCRR